MTLVDTLDKIHRIQVFLHTQARQDHLTQDNPESILVKNHLEIIPVRVPEGHRVHSLCLDSPVDPVLLASIPVLFHQHSVQTALVPTKVGTTLLYPVNPI